MLQVFFCELSKNFWNVFLMHSGVDNWRMFIFCLRFFKVFKILLVFMILYCLLLYIWPLIYLFVPGRDRFLTVYRNFFSNFSYKLFLNILYFYYKIMKKLYMRTVIGSSGMYCVLITLFQLYDSKAEPFKVLYSGLVSFTLLQPSY